MRTGYRTTNPRSVARELIEQLRPAIDSDGYWGRDPMFSDEQHLGYYMGGAKPETPPPPQEALVAELKRFWIPQAKKCFEDITRSVAEYESNLKKMG